jgi:hypothetical protein
MLAKLMKSPSSSEGPDLIQKLVQLALGDVELVNRAIRASMGPEGAADLGKIIQYIEKNRRHEAAARHAEMVAR